MNKQLISLSWFKSPQTSWLFILVFLLFYLLLGTHVKAQVEETDENLEVTASPIGLEAKKLVVALPTLSGIQHEWQGDLPKVTLFLEELWRYLGEQYGVEVEFKKLNMKQHLPALRSGQVDIVALAMFSEDDFQQVYYSVPYIELTPSAYHRITEKPKHPRLAVIHPPQIEIEIAHEDRYERVDGEDLDVLLNQDENYHVIYAWAPWIADSVLARHGLRELYQPLQGAVAPLAVRAMVLRQNRKLMLALNRVLWTIDPERIEAMWQKHVDSETTKFNLRLGEFEFELSANQQEYILEHPVVHYGVMENGYPPYIISDELAVSGLSVDLLNSISRRIGLEIRPKRFDTVTKTFAALERGEIQIFPNIYITEARRKLFLFSVPYGRAVPAFLSRVDDDFSSMSQLDDARIAAVKGYYESHIMSSSLPNNQFLFVDDAEEAINALMDGLADVFMDDWLASIYRTGKGEWGELVVNKVADLESDLRFRMAMPLGQQQLVELMDAGLQTFSPIEMERLRQKWGNTKYEEQHSSTADITRIALIGSVALMFALLIFTYQFNQLKKRKRSEVTLAKALQEAEQAKSEAQLAARGNSEFLARMSHEIRTPMNGVLGMAEALSFTQLDKEQKELLEVLNGSARNLMALLNDVLDFSKMDAGKLALESTPIKLDKLLSGVLDNYRHKTISSNLELTSKTDPALNAVYLADPTRLMQVLNNLVSNAIKFTSEGFVELNAQLIDDHYAVKGQSGIHHLVRFDIRDSGIGIATENQKHLFDPFVQAEDDTTRRFGGSGLGLSICKEIVDTMGGQIAVSSMPGVGSLFSVTLALEPDVTVDFVDLADTSQLNQDELRASALSQLRVLVAEDNKVNVKVICGQLGRLGIRADVAENGLIAYNLMQEKEYDLLLSDCHMPEMDGFELAGLLSSQREGKLPYLVAVTADALSGAAKKCLDSGFDDYVSKPCTLDTLREKLHRTSQIVGIDAELAEEVTEAQHADPEPTPEEPSTPVLEDASSILAFEDPSKLENEAVASVQSQSQPEPEPAPELSGSHLAREHVLCLIGGDESLIADVLEAYLEQADASAFEQAVQDKDEDQVKALAHKIAGALSYLGANELVGVAKRIETQNFIEDEEGYQRHLGALRQGLDEIEIEIQNWLAELAADHSADDIGD